MKPKLIEQPFKPSFSNLDDYLGENTFAMIGAVRKMLALAGQKDAAGEFCDRVMSADSQAAAFDIAREYVEAP